ncbi:hypothetical protein ONV78_18480 [Hahella sp. CR1]|uniref:hypothetical protein n=1 Tax=Hahella sp. CR1 TaxID=2992807 RepID=UPI0024423655|nr:hypothetical protein [Hahella sp. CR1]MDG9669728.1 hypothetical protein [Hahella sp. CR1]
MFLSVNSTSILFEKREALSLIQSFSGKKDTASFPNITREDFYYYLRKRVNKPQSIYQQDASLCGPAAFIYILATQKPLAYVKYAIDLYERGVASIGNIVVKPSRACRSYTYSSAINVCDWVTLASLRDSENLFFNYDSHSDAISGITLPSKISEWFKKSGYTTVENNTNLIFDKSASNLANASRKFLSGHNVCLFVGSDIFIGTKKGRAPADHWVVLTSPILVDNKPISSFFTNGSRREDESAMWDKKISFTVYTWGNDHWPVNRNISDLKMGDFMDFYYGFVSAK